MAEEFIPYVIGQGLGYAGVGLYRAGQAGLNYVSTNNANNMGENYGNVKMEMVEQANEEMDVVVPPLPTDAFDTPVRARLGRIGVRGRTNDLGNIPVTDISPFKITKRIFPPYFDQALLTIRRKNGLQKTYRKKKTYAKKKFYRSRR